MLACLFEHAPSSSPLFSASCTHLFPVVSQTPDFKALTHSIQNIRGYTLSFPKRIRLTTEHATLSALAFFFSAGQQAGSHCRGERGAPEPREAHIKLAEAWIEVNRNAHPVAYRERMRRGREIRRKMVESPRQYRPYANHHEEKHQCEHKKHVAHRYHVRRTGRPGTG